MAPLVDPVPEVVKVKTDEFATLVGINDARSSPVPETVPEVKSIVGF